MSDGTTYVKIDEKQFGITLRYTKYGKIDVALLIMSI